MKYKNIAIVASGLKVPKMKRLIKKTSIIIAADGGTKNCLKCNIVPDYIVGDMDSITSFQQEKLAKCEIIERKDQNFTDLQKALQFAKTLKPTSIQIFSVFGKRTDHFVANLMILQNYSESANITIYDKGGEMIILKPGIHKFTDQRIDQIISIFSFQKVQQLTLKGFKYDLSCENFTSNFIGVSNVIKKSNCEISFIKGKLFYYKNYFIE